MKNFIKDLNIKKMSASELACVIDENQKEFADFYVKNGFKAKNAEMINSLYEKMLSPKFVKALKKVAKNGSEDGGSWSGLDYGFIVVINGFIEKNHKNEALSEELLADYTKIINKVLKSKINSIAKDVNIEKDIVKELLVVVPDKSCVNSPRAAGFYCQKMLRKLYIISADRNIGLEKTKNVKILFQKLFGKKLLDVVAVNMLLEKKEFMKGFNENQTALWNLITDFALDYINNQDKDHITELVEYYCDRRKSDSDRNRDSARRISLMHIDQEKYPALAKRIRKFTKEGKESLVKFL